MIDQIKIAIILEDDSLVIMSFITNDYRNISIEPTTENIEKEIRKSRSNIKSWRIITDDEIPPDRTYRNAWKDSGKIEHDIEKAKEIHKDILRLERQGYLNDLDVQYMKALETNNDTEKTLIVQKKQKLRDITKHPDFDKVKTIEDLKKIKIE